MEKKYPYSIFAFIVLGSIVVFTALLGYIYAINFFSQTGEISSYYHCPTQTIQGEFNQTNSYHNTSVLSLAFTWDYNGKPQQLKIQIPQLIYDNYRKKPHTEKNNYAPYVFSDSDRPYLQMIVDGIRDAGIKDNLTEYDTIMNIISFIQSLPYTSDNVSTGYDDYTRYPLETIVDAGGDCEDTAILTAALLDQMGYGTVLVLFPSHLGVGVRASDSYPGAYFEYQGNRYYYLETTGKGFGIGDIPEMYRNKSAIIIPLTRKPSITIKVASILNSSDSNISVYNIDCVIRNTGTETAVNPTLNIAALAISQGSGFIWAPDTTIHLADIPEHSDPVNVDTTVIIPTGQLSQIRCTLYGSNFDTIMTLSEQFTA